MLPIVDKREKTCFHEAGHMTYNSHLKLYVVAVRIYFNPNEIDLQYDGETETHTFNPETPASFLPEIGPHPSETFDLALEKHFGGIVAEVMCAMQSPWDKTKILDLAINPGSHRYALSSGTVEIRKDYRDAIALIKNNGRSDEEQILLRTAAGNVFDFHSQSSNWELLTSIAKVMQERYNPNLGSDGVYVSTVRRIDLSNEIRLKLSKL